MREQATRFNEWITDPDHHRLTYFLIPWTCICLVVTVAYLRAGNPYGGAVWAFFSLLAVINTVRSMS